ncbi:hypothetical protein E4T66_01940 [Sinimarinibacterium sp. CAU 1509]|uniref:hypothetical protein n=1 Tax=Sinimarinibacterium sp. CAU 1509 TaxID=2562283 RepID=UPI0010AC088A|nr:hypothetical protein [Sinimarinibacterium sp. CAU 1509]TJY65009.1 hypothetical protein E4T66_01940 [Sinimarinibacterium sp. CAU 1509]
MRHTAPAGQRPNRRRNPAAAATAPAQDNRYRRAPVRRQSAAAAVAIPRVSTTPVDAVWPEWIIPGAMGSVMLMISVYHHSALVDAVLRLF